MNYDSARQVALTADALGGWHWTTMNDGRVRPAAPCRRYIGPPLDHRLPFKPAEASDFETCEPHATKEEAERHFYDYSLEQVEEESYSSWQDCVVCGAATKTGLGTRSMALLFSGDALCDAHLSKEKLAELHPFQPGYQLIHS